MSNRMTFDTMWIYLIWHSGKYISGCLIFQTAEKIQDRLHRTPSRFSPALNNRPDMR